MVAAGAQTERTPRPRSSVQRRPVGIGWPTPAPATRARRGSTRSCTSRASRSRSAGRTAQRSGSGQPRAGHGEPRRGNPRGATRARSVLVSTSAAGLLRRIAARRYSRRRPSPAPAGRLPRRRSCRGLGGRPRTRRLRLACGSSSSATACVLPALREARSRSSCRRSRLGVGWSGRRRAPVHAVDLDRRRDPDVDDRARRRSLVGRDQLLRAGAGTKAQSCSHKTLGPSRCTARRSCRLPEFDGPGAVRRDGHRRCWPASGWSRARAALRSATSSSWPELDARAGQRRLATPAGPEARSSLPRRERPAAVGPSTFHFEPGLRRQQQHDQQPDRRQQQPERQAHALAVALALGQPRRRRPPTAAR